MPRRFMADDAMLRAAFRAARRSYVPRPRERPLVSTERGMEIRGAFTAHLPAYNRRGGQLYGLPRARGHIASGTAPRLAAS